MTRPPLWRHVGTFADRRSADDVIAAFRAFRTRVVADARGYRVERESTEDELVERDRVLVMRAIADCERHPAPRVFGAADSAAIRATL